MKINFLAQVQQGMRVFDRTHSEIGRVESVKLGDDDPTTPEVESVTADRNERRETMIDAFARMFDSDNLPREVRDRLLQQGFVRIDSAGIFAADRYVTPDQILSVEGDELMLNVSRDELLKH